jgi:hypothetical protein
MNVTTHTQGGREDEKKHKTGFLRSRTRNLLVESSIEVSSQDAAS